MPTRHPTKADTDRQKPTEPVSFDADNSRQGSIEPSGVVGCRTPTNRKRPEPRLSRAARLSMLVLGMKP